jgi:pimeloyl-ACP methyl ester carboxylesterase
VLTASAQRELWYQAFHQLALSEQLIDGNREAVRAYLRHFWSHWSAPDYQQSEADLERLADIYSQPDAFTASIGWYRAGAGAVAVSVAETIPDPGARISVDATILWPEHDPLFPRAWGDRIEDFFSRAKVRTLAGVGHFVPVEAPRDLASAIADALAMQPETR